jgi:hypothetical protein
MATSADGAGPGERGPGPGAVPDHRPPVGPLGPTGRLRAWCSALLITLAAVLAPLSAISVWVADELADTDRYVATMAPLSSNPDVQAAVTDRATDAIMSGVGLDALLSGVPADDRSRLRAALDAAGGPITSGIRDFTRSTVAAFVAGDTFATLWKQLNRQAHNAVTGALTGENDSAVQLRGNAVVLDLAPVVDQVKQQLTDRGLVAASRVPAARTHFTLMQSDDVEHARTAFRVLRAAGNWLPVLTVVLAGGGVLLAVRRRRALVAAALAVTAGVAVLGVGLAVFRAVYLDHLPVGADDRAAGAIYDQLVRFLRMTVRVVVVLGVVVAFGAWLSGPGRWAVRVGAMWESAIAAAREAAGITSTGAVGPWVHRYRHALRWGAVLAATAVLLWSGPTGTVIFWITVMTVVVLAVIEFLDDRRHPRGPVVNPK